MMESNTLLRPEKSHATADAAEREIRCDLAACYRLTDHFRWNDLTYTHISARLDDREEFLLNPFGLLFDEVTASNLVKVDPDGRVLHDPSGLGVNAAGFVIHSAVHAARPDVRCVMHTHTAAGMAVSTHPKGLLPITQHAMRFHNRIGRHAYEGIALDPGERERLARDLGMNGALILENHGLLTCAATIAEAFNLMYYLERACQAQVASLSSGTVPIKAADEAVEKTARIFDQYGAEASRRDWKAMLRMLDKQNLSFRD
jgi:ribulose-5-phosphate 4-epimerase/fuculose-1-phosphate aldolase